MTGWRLRIVHGNGTGQEFPLDAAEMTLGRSPDNAICIPDNNCSRVHARLFVVGGKAVIQDNRSSNGLFVNNQRVKEHTLRPGDKIGIGNTILEFSPAGGAVAQAGRQQPQAQRGRQPAGRQTGRTGRTGAATGRTRGPQKSSGSGGNGRLVLYSIAGGAVLLIGGAFAVNQMRNTGQATPAPLPTRVKLDPIPTITRGKNNLSQRQQKARELVDHGDSKVVSGDLMGAYRLYAEAVSVDKQCPICKKRALDAKTAILKKVDDYERGGLIAYEAGRFNEAAERWTSAAELVTPFDNGRAKALRARMQEARSKAREFNP